MEGSPPGHVGRVDVDASRRCERGRKTTWKGDTQEASDGDQRLATLLPYCFGGTGHGGLGKRPRWVGPGPCDREKKRKNQAFFYLKINRKGLGVFQKRLRNLNAQKYAK